MRAVDKRSERQFVPYGLVGVIAFRVAMLVFADGLVEVVGFDRHLDHVHFIAIEIEDEKPHAIAFAAREDERLFVAMTAGFTNHSRPPLAELLLDDPIQLFTISGPGEVLELGDVHLTHAAMRGFAREQTCQAHERDTRGAHVILLLDGVDHAVEAAFSTRRAHYPGHEHRDGQYRTTQRNPKPAIHC